MRTAGSSIPHPNKDDGEFYMEMSDFLRYFEQCTICNLTPDVDRDGDADTLRKYKISLCQTTILFIIFHLLTKLIEKSYQEEFEEFEDTKGGTQNS